MRWRLSERRSNPYSCCFCCHVRLGTVLIGIFSLVSTVVRVLRVVNNILQVKVASSELTIHTFPTVQNGGSITDVWMRNPQQTVPHNHAADNLAVLVAAEVVKMKKRAAETREKPSVNPGFHYPS